jgi:hypothetical protein
MTGVARHHPKKNHPPPFHSTKIFSTAASKKVKTTFIWQKNLSLLALPPHHETK